PTAAARPVQPRGQQLLAPLPQRAGRPVFDQESAARAGGEREPVLAAREAVGGEEQRADRLARRHAQEHVLEAAVAHHRGCAAARRRTRGLELRGHAAAAERALGSTRRAHHGGADLLHPLAPPRPPLPPPPPPPGPTRAAP